MGKQYLLIAPLYDVPAGATIIRSVAGMTYKVHRRLFIHNVDGEVAQTVEASAGTVLLISEQGEIVEHPGDMQVTWLATRADVLDYVG